MNSPLQGGKRRRAPAGSWLVAAALLVVVVLAGVAGWLLLGHDDGGSVAAPAARAPVGAQNASRPDNGGWPPGLRPPHRGHVLRVKFKHPPAAGIAYDMRTG